MHTIKLKNPIIDQLKGAIIQDKSKSQLMLNMWIFK